MTIDFLKLEGNKFIPLTQIDLPFVPINGNIYLLDNSSYKVSEIIFTGTKIAAVIEIVDDIYTELHHTLM